MCDYCDDEHPTNCCAELNLIRMAMGSESLVHNGCPDWEKDGTFGFCRISGNYPYKHANARKNCPWRYWGK